MKKQITFGLIASALALSTAAFAPTEAQATEQEKRLNQLAMQMYMNNQSIAAQQQYYNNPYSYNNGFNNPYGYNNGFNNSYGYNNGLNPYYTNRVINGNNWSNNHTYLNNNGWNNGYSNGYNQNLRLNSVGRILNRIF
ncbi:MAG: hypothetical protein C0469_07605 [Cyanobacteria bacterium DS2.3.42]|nr:hypothetical protein [Cyanobacteria bacterium DS2.3.42]